LLRGRAAAHTRSMRFYREPTLAPAPVLKDALATVPNFKRRAESEQKAIREAFSCFANTRVLRVDVYRDDAQQGAGRWLLVIDSIGYTDLPQTAHKVGMASRSGNWCEDLR